ncbi:hypothetical protein ADL26_08170, partial [Thermoactinomyces vulgaris]
MTDTITPQALLERAAEIIDQRGWHQGDYADHNGCVCTLGALRIAAAGLPTDAPFWDARSAALDTSGRFNGPGYDQVDLAAVALEEYLSGHGIEAFGIAEWNDHIAASKEEVTAALRAAAAEAQS